MEYTYYAFISYKREDEKWAKWLQKKLEAYGFPTALRKENPTLPSKIRPVFRDQSELSGGNLKDEIEKGLKGSKYLIVICSPRAAKSPWVSKEVQYFIDHGGENNIIPFIIGGSPNATNPEDECFPEGLRQLSGEKEILGININEMGRDAATIKVIARMFGLRFDTLWQRHERAKRNRRIAIIAGTLTFAILSFGIGAYMVYLNTQIAAERDRAENQTKIANQERNRANNEYNNVLKANKALAQAKDSILLQSNLIAQTNKNLEESNRELEKERDNVLTTNWFLMASQSKSAAGIANDLIQKGNPLMAQRITMNYMPDSASNFIWPYVPDIEQAYRKALSYRYSAEWHQDAYIEHKLAVNSASFNSKGDKIVTASNDNTAVLWNINTGDTLTLQHNWLVNCAAISEDGKFIATGCRDKYVRLWDAETGRLLDAWKLSGNVWEVMFTKDNKYIFSYDSDNDLSVYTIENNKLLGRLPYHQHLSHNILDETGYSFVYNFMDSVITSVRIPLLVDNFSLIEEIAKRKDIDAFEKLLSHMQPNDITPIVLPHRYHIKDLKYNGKTGTVCILSRDSLATLGDLRTGSIVDQIPNVIDYSFSPNGSTLALSKSDGHVSLISLEQGLYNKKGISIDTDVSLKQIQYSDDGIYLIGTSNDKIYIWDVIDNYSELTILRHKSPIKYSSINNDGKNVVTITNDYRVNLWGHSKDYNKTSLAIVDSYANAITFNKEETKFYVASYDGHISCYDIITGKQSWRIPTYTGNFKGLQNNCIAVNNDGTLLAVGNDNGEVLVVDAIFGSLLHRYQIHDGNIYSIFFVDENKVITASRDKKVIISDIPHEKVITTYRHDKPVIYANITKGLNQIISATSNGLFLWQKNSTKSIYFPILNDNIESVAYNAPTNRVAIGTSNGTIAIKSVDKLNDQGLIFQHGESRKPEFFLFDSFLSINHDSSLMERMQGSMEGNFLASNLFDLLSHKGKVDALQFSNDGSYLISKCNKSIKVWDTATGVCVNDEIRIGIGFRCFAMSPQKKYIATSCMDIKNEIPNKKNRIIDYLFLWKYNSLNSSLSNEKRQIPNWKLTPKEKRRYYLE